MKDQLIIQSQQFERLLTYFYVIGWTVVLTRLRMYLDHWHWHSMSDGLLDISSFDWSLVMKK